MAVGLNWIRDKYSGKPAHHYEVAKTSVRTSSPFANSASCWLSFCNKCSIKMEGLTRYVTTNGEVSSSNNCHKFEVPQSLHLSRPPLSCMNKTRKRVDPNRMTGKWALDPHRHMRVFTTTKSLRLTRQAEETRPCIRKCMPPGSTPASLFRYTRSYLLTRKTRMYTL